MELPLEEEDILQFVLWMRKARGLQASTIQNMITAMKKVAVSLGSSDMCDHLVVMR